MAWVSVFAGAGGGMVLAAFAFAAGWPLWLVLLLYPAAGAALTGLVLLALGTAGEQRRKEPSATGPEDAAPPAGPAETGAEAAKLPGSAPRAGSCGL